jgi:hypothetical protein
MGRGPRHLVGFDPEQGAVLHHRPAPPGGAFGVEQVTVAAIQASQSAGQDWTPTITSAQVRLV